MDAFIAGSVYGMTTVMVGQPFDTIKTRLQATPGSSSSVVPTAHSPPLSNVASTTVRQGFWETGRHIFKAEGIRGLYRGGLPLIAGGATIRSAQFGVYGMAMQRIRQYNDGKATQQDERIWGIFDPQVILAGFAGGFGRGLVEGPFEYLKVRRQVAKEWKLSEIFSGSGATIFRNSFLFSSFVIYIDLSKQIIPGGLPPFLEGAICSNLAWLTIWPLDVAKSQIQSGNYRGKSYWLIIRGIFTTGAIFRGIVPGLMRSTIANGCSMVAYKRTEAFLKELRDEGII